MQADSSQRKRWRSENVTDVEPFVLQNAFDSPMTAKVAPLVTLPASTTKVLPAELVRAAAAARNSPLNNPSGQSSSRFLRHSVGVTTCGCFVWTVWLLLLNVAPNATVNFVMSTASLDEGTFWRFVDPPLPLFWLTSVGLACVGAGYAFVLTELVFPRTWIRRVPPFSRQREVLGAWRSGLQGFVARVDSSKSVFPHVASAISSMYNSAWQRMNVTSKIVDLAVETVMLVQILEAGTPVGLVATFTSTVSLNALWSAAILFRSQEERARFIDLVFDVFIAVGYPTCVVIYCLSTFTFDRAAFAINVEVFPPGWLERSASAFADPVQNAVIYKSLSSLRIHSVYEFVTRIGVNVALGLRLHTVVGAIRDPGRQRCAAYPKRQRMLPFLLVMYALLLVLFVVRSTKTSTAACEAHPNCAVFAKRWVPAGGAAEPKCPCLMLVDCDFGPKTYAEWLRPKDATESVAALAAMGLLQTVQVMNRYLPVIPQELRSCTDLRYLSLVYTHTATFPDWFGEFAKMEYMFVEGNPAAALVALPENMFDLMPSLTYLHLAWHVAMPRLPSLHGLTALKSLELAGLLSLQTLPSFSSLHQLERFVLSASPLVDRLPDLAAIENLQTFSAYDRGAWCCNGDLGRCDLQNPLCAVHPVWGTPAATCLHPEQVASEATIKLAAKFAPTICGPVLHPSDLEPPLTEAMVAQCGGTRFKRCELPGFDEAICYNMRFTVLTCVHSPFTIKMRRRQIQERVGDPCSVEHEAWLGCT